MALPQPRAAPATNSTPWLPPSSHGDQALLPLGGHARHLPRGLRLRRRHLQVERSGDGGGASRCDSRDGLGAGLAGARRHGRVCAGTSPGPGRRSSSIRRRAVVSSEPRSRRSTGSAWRSSSASVAGATRCSSSPPWSGTLPPARRDRATRCSTIITTTGPPPPADAGHLRRERGRRGLICLRCWSCYFWVRTFFLCT